MDLCSTVLITQTRQYHHKIKGSFQRIFNLLQWLTGSLNYVSMSGPSI